MNSNKATTALLFISAAIFLFGTGYKMGEYKAVKRPSYPVMSAFGQAQNNGSHDVDFTLFWDTWAKLEEKFVDRSKLDSKKMYYGAIKGMAASLEDPYTFFLTPEENKQSKDDLGGKFEGIGAQLGMRENRVVIIAPLKQSPAERAGLKSGDIIIKVDDEEILDLTLVQAVSKIRGTKGTKVKLTIVRASETKDIEIVRDEIKVPTIELSYPTKSNCTGTCPQVAHLKLNQFGDNTNEEWDKAVAEIDTKWKSGQISGMVLDLRDNPGGYLESSVYLAAEFLEKGQLVVKQETIKESDSRSYHAQRTGKLQKIPLTVIVNQGSASASEILAGALRDYGRAKLVGAKSFGKGSVQEAIDLKDNAGLHVTVAKWVLPKGDWINGTGIDPEIKITPTPATATGSEDEEDIQLERAIEEVVK